MAICYWLKGAMVLIISVVAVTGVMLILHLSKRGMYETVRHQPIKIFSQILSKTFTKRKMIVP